MTPTEAEVRTVYAEARAFYEEVRPKLGAADFGYEVLYGPALVCPPVFFLGFQPGGRNGGGGGEYTRTNVEPPWPSRSEYGDPSVRYRLVERLRMAFPESFLARCTGANALFFRSPNVSEYGKVDQRTRDEIRARSTFMAQRLIRATAPSLIVALGFGTLDLFDRRWRTVMRGDR
jgi:hypothetical protein